MKTKKIIIIAFSLLGVFYVSSNAHADPCKLAVDKDKILFCAPTSKKFHCTLKVQSENEKTPFSCLTSKNPYKTLTGIDTNSGALLKVNQKLLKISNKRAVRHQVVKKIRINWGAAWDKVKSVASSVAIAIGDIAGAISSAIGSIFHYEMSWDEFQKD